MVKKQSAAQSFDMFWGFFSYVLFVFKDVFLPANVHVRLHDTIRSAQQLALKVNTPAHENCFPFKYFISSKRLW